MSASACSGEPAARSKPQRQRSTRSRKIPVRRNLSATARLLACGAKIFMDGSTAARTAWVSQPWHKNSTEIDEGNFGYPTMEPEVYRQMVRLFHQAAVTVGTHAIGDRAIDWVVDTYALVLKETPTPGLRHTIIHAYLPTPHAITTMATLEKQYDAGYPELQPPFLWWLGKTLSASLGPDRLPLAMPLKTYLDHGVRWGGGSDHYVAPYPARYGLWASVERESLAGTHPFGMSEAVDIHTALRSYTAWAAPLLFLEDEDRHPRTRQASRHRNLGQQPLHHPLRKTQRHQVRDDPLRRQNRLQGRQHEHHDGAQEVITR